MWEFSPSSLPLLEKCIQAARQPDPLWFSIVQTQKLEIHNMDCDSPVVNRLIGDNRPLERLVYQMDTDNSSVTHKNELVAEQNEEAKSANCEFEQICRDIEEDTIKTFTFYSEKLINEEKLLPALAQNLSIGCIQKICNTIVDDLHINPNLLTKLFNHFIPVYFKRENICNCVKLIIEVHKRWPDLSKALIEVLLQDTDMSSMWVHQLVKNVFDVLDKSALSKYNELLQIELTREAFVHHLQTMLLLYETSTKTAQVQGLVLQMLIEASPLCEDNKNYGRFLHSFLQVQKVLGALRNKETLETIVEAHKSLYKNPCLKILNQL